MLDQTLTFYPNDLIIHSVLTPVAWEAPGWSEPLISGSVSAIALPANVLV